MTWEMPLIVGAYFIGSVPFGYILARAVRGVDIRTVGSGNIGATNVGRIMGRGWGLFVFALDVLKGLLPAYIGKELGGPELAVLGGLAVIIGHNWPIFLGFRGGKGVATSCGVLLAVFPPGLFISLGVWAIAVGLWRYVSLGSMLGAVALFISALLLQKEPFGEGKFITAFVALTAIMTILRHRSNIVRLVRGTESKIGMKEIEHTRHGDTT